MTRAGADQGATRRGAFLPDPVGGSTPGEAFGLVVDTTAADGATHGCGVGATVVVAAGARVACGGFGGRSMFSPGGL